MGRTDAGDPQNSPTPPLGRLPGAPQIRRAARTQAGLAQAGLNQWNANEEVWQPAPV